MQEVFQTSTTEYLVTRYKTEVFNLWVATQKRVARLRTSDIRHLLMIGKYIYPTNIGIARGGGTHHITLHHLLVHGVRNARAGF